MWTCGRVSCLGICDRNEIMRLNPFSDLAKNWSGTRQVQSNWLYSAVRFLKVKYVASDTFGRVSKSCYDHALIRWLPTHVWTRRSFIVSGLFRHSSPSQQDHVLLHVKGLIRYWLSHRSNGVSNSSSMSNRFICQGDNTWNQYVVFYLTL